MPARVIRCKGRTEGWGLCVPLRPRRGKAAGMRKTVVLFASLALAVLLASGAALAATYASFEAETMNRGPNVVLASGGTAIRYDKSDAVANKGGVNVAERSDRIIVRGAINAGADTRVCARVRVDGDPAGSLACRPAGPTPAYGDKVFSGLNITKGTHTFAVVSAEVGTGEALYVDRVRVEGPDAPTPSYGADCPQRANALVVQPGQDLAALADARTGPTTFCVRDGVHTVDNDVTTQSGDDYIGMYSDGTRPTLRIVAPAGVTGNNVMDGNGEVGVENLDISGTLHNNECEPECGRGISGGKILAVNINSHDNENAGIGGCSTDTVVRDSVLSRNGNADSAADGVGPGGGPARVSAAGIKCINPFSVFNTDFVDNYWNGVWCDEECGRIEVRGSTFVRNGKSGIHDEISSGPAVFAGNTFDDNGHRTEAGSNRGGILVIQSRDADIFGNKFNGQVSGIAVKLQAQARRTPFAHGNIRVEDNDLNNGDTVEGCDSAPDNSCVRNQ